MTFLPIVARELRLASRRRGTYWSRVATVALALGLFVWALALVPNFLPTSTQGATLFKTLSWFALVYALMAGLRATSDSISSEKREGTLGLLFLTDLKGYDVVLGKAAAKGLGPLYGLIGMLPVLAIPILMGGVTAWQFWQAAIALLNSLFFSLAAGMFSSAVSRVERKALGGAFLIVLVFTLGFPVAGIICYQSTRSETWAEVLGLISPGYAFAMTQGPVWSSGPYVFWISLAVVHGLSWLMFVLACRIAPRVWQEKSATVRRVRWREGWRNWLLGNPAWRAAFRRRMLDLNPILWLASRYRFARLHPWVLLVAMTGMVLWSCWIDREVVLGFGLALSIAINIIFKYWIGLFAVSALAGEGDRGSLELLLSTPLTIAEILRGQWLALRRQFAAPFAVAVVLQLALAAHGLALHARNQNDNFDWAVVILVMNLLVFLLDSIALAWLGMWMAVKLKSAQRAATAAAVRVLVLPWAAMLLPILIVALHPPHQFPVILPLTWFVASVVADVGFALYAFENLRTNLRAVATEQVPLKR